MERMSLLSSLFRSRKNLSKEVKQIEEGEEEGPCTSYSHKEEDKKHGGKLDHQILIEYLFEYNY